MRGWADLQLQVPTLACGRHEAALVDNALLLFAHVTENGINFECADMTSATPES